MVAVLKQVRALSCDSYVLKMLVMTLASWLLTPGTDVESAAKTPDETENTGLADSSVNKQNH